jgi:hypothetical protein
VVSGVRLYLSNRETQKLEEFITEFQDIFKRKSDAYGQTEFTTALIPVTPVQSVSPP